MPLTEIDNLEPVTEDHEISPKLRKLMILRLVLAPLGFGMTVAAGINLILAVTRLFTGDFSKLRSLLPSFLIAAAFTALSAAAVPRIDRRILDLVSRAPGKTTCLQMLNLAIGLPLGKNRAAMEAELARQLSEVDEPWWTTHTKELREQVNAALELARNPSWLHPMDGPWIPALFQAIARCGRTEYIRPIQSILKRDKKKSLPQPITEAAQVSLEKLLIRQQRDREAATLLRPAGAAEEYLLYPVVATPEVDSELLLRPDPSTEGPTQPISIEVGPSSEVASFRSH